MRITLRQAAGAGEVFGEHALDANIGGTIRVDLGERQAEGVILDARALEGGRAMEVAVEIAEGELTRRVESALSPMLDRFSVGVEPPRA